MMRSYTFEEILSERGHIVYTNVGHSMMPLLRQNHDIIEIHPKEEGRCKKYDIVLYKRGEMYVLHRILKVLSKGYIIAGDNNAFVERDITDEKIIGVVTRIIRDGKEIYMGELGYRLYVHIWCDFYPVRIALLRMKNCCIRGIIFLKRRLLKG